MSDCIINVRANRERIAALRKILKDMDPASGVAISFRRGVARDNDDVENDDERRPWTTVECDPAHARVALTAAIDAAKDSEAFWLKRAKEEHAALSKFLDGEK